MVVTFLEKTLTLRDETQVSVSMAGPELVLDILVGLLLVAVLGNQPVIAR